LTASSGVLASSRPASSLAGALLLSLGLVLAAAVFGGFLVYSRAPRDSVTVTGAATVPFESDIVKWSMSLARRVPLDGLSTGYPLLEADLEALLDRLVAAGVGRSDIQVLPVQTQQEYGSGGVVDAWTLRQALFLVSGEVDRVEALAQRPGSLLRDGSVMENSNLEFFYSETDRLKRELLARATDDARDRAEEIAGSSGGTLGRMITARAGVFQITEPLSTEVASYGIYNTATRNKQITVTVNGVFVLK
jgi:hypothetical protein